MSKRHFELGPSASEGFVACSAKPSRERGLPNPGNAASDWGTVAHELAERVLTGQALPTEPTARVVNGDVEFGAEYSTDLDDEMWACVHTYCDYVTSIPGTRHIEQRVPVDHITGEPGGSGTADAIVVALPLVTVIDLKGGMVQVDAVVELDEVRRPNYQLGMYASGALRLHPGAKRVRLIIVQPRLHHVSEYECSVDELEAHMAVVRERSDATRAPNAPATPGEKQCRYCRAKGTCSELQQAVLSAAIAKFPDLDDPQPAPLGVASLSESMRLVPIVRMWADAVEARLYDELKVGHQHPGWKLVTGRGGHRRWVRHEDAQLVLELAGVDPFKRTLITPAAADALLKKAQPDAWKVLSTNVEQPPGQPTLVPASDHRPTVSTASCFTSLD